MKLSSGGVLSLLGYIVVANEEIHSEQIKWIERILDTYQIQEYREYIYNILNDAEEKTDYNQALELLKNESEEAKRIVCLSCYQIAVIDNESFDEKALDSSESTILSDICNAAGFNVTYMKTLRKNAKKELDSEKKRLLTNEKNSFAADLTTDLKSITKAAGEDYEHLSEATKAIMSCCDLLQRRLSRADNITNPQLKSAMLNFSDKYQRQIINILKDIKDNLFQKELASKSFSLALLGRTKAGKSTLHCIMCGEGEDFIGKGGQRTTRFNRVFSWNGLKIIDTPGIGAGESNGRKDEEIARRAIVQADMICFVTIDDTTLEESFDLLNTIIKYNKPLLILLNHKDDIKYKAGRRKKFEEDPYKWKEASGEQRLDGWINRLERNVKESYKDIMRVIPVFLLAAQIGKFDNKRLYYDASNYEELIGQIKSLFENNCFMYKSQTMLGEPSIKLHELLSILKNEEKIISVFNEKVIGIRERTLDSLDKKQKEVKSRSLEFIDSEFDDFFTKHGSQYAEDNINQKNISQMKKNYEDIFKSSGILKRIESEIDRYITDYRTGITDIVKDLEEEIRYAEINISNMDMFSSEDFGTLQKTKGNVPVKGILKAISVALDVASIWAPPLMFVSIPLSFFGGFFKSKNRKKQISVNIMVDNFRKMTDSQKDNLKKSVSKGLERALAEDKEKLVSFFDALTCQVSSVLEYIGDCRAEFDKRLREIDTFYAIRILQFINEDAETPDFSSADDVIPYRDPESNNFNIYTRNGSSFNVKKIYSVTGENITVKTYRKS